MQNFSDMKSRFAQSPFRSRFQLNETERAYLVSRGWGVIHTQARHIIRERLALAHPHKDGSQTPMRGHVVFKAQHATATCCRGCLEKWHHIPQGRALTDLEVEQITQMLVDWMRDQAGDLSRFPVTPDLFASDLKESEKQAAYPLPSGNGSDDFADDKS